MLGEGAVYEHGRLHSKDTGPEDHWVDSYEQVMKQRWVDCTKSKICSYIFHSKYSWNFESYRFKYIQINTAQNQKKAGLHAFLSDNVSFRKRGEDTMQQIKQPT